MRDQDTLEMTAPSAIVLVEDDSIRRILAFFLESSEVSRSLPRTGQAAAKALCNGVPQLLITDRLLPPWPGLGRISEVKSRHGALSVAMLEDAQSSSRDLSKAAGVDFVLSVPVLRHEVLGCLPTGPSRFNPRQVRRLGM